MSRPASGSDADHSDSRVVRVFISSTFRDFAEERDLLAKRVFPELRRRARGRFVEIIGVDLRWGITEEQANDGQTLPLCLREIDRARPYFIGLLGERYGWTPGSDLYPDDLLARQPWLREHAGGTSVTELEILHGVLNNPEMAGRATFYLRDPAWSAERGEDFRSEGEQDRAKLDRLKHRLRESPFPTLDYETPEELADRVLEDLWATIDAEYPADDVPDELERERRGHEAYAEVRRRVYIGQEETVAALLSRLDSASDEPGEEGSKGRTTLITGESGIGKSSLLANVLHEYRLRHPDNIVIERYSAATANFHLYQFLRSVASEILKITGSSDAVESDFSQLRLQFAAILLEASKWARKQKRILVVALDGLERIPARGSLAWLPHETPPRIRLLLTSSDHNDWLWATRRQCEAVEPPGLRAATIREVIQAKVGRSGRSLSPPQVTRICKHPLSSKPVFIEAILNELAVARSPAELATNLDRCLSSDTIASLYELILARLDSDSSSSFPEAALSLLTLSPTGGLSRHDLLTASGGNDLGFSILEYALGESLGYQGNQLAIFSSHLTNAIHSRYLVEPGRIQQVHKHLAEYWSRKEPGRREAELLEYHLYHASDAVAYCQILLSRPAADPESPDSTHQSTSDIWLRFLDFHRTAEAMQLVLDQAKAGDVAAKKLAKESADALFHSLQRGQFKSFPTDREAFEFVAAADADLLTSSLIFERQWRTSPTMPDYRTLAIAAQEARERYDGDWVEDDLDFDGDALEALMRPLSSWKEAYALQNKLWTAFNSPSVVDGRIQDKRQCKDWWLAPGSVSATLGRLAEELVRRREEERVHWISGSGLRLWTEVRVPSLQTLQLALAQGTLRSETPNWLLALLHQHVALDGGEFWADGLYHSRRANWRRKSTKKERLVESHIGTSVDLLRANAETNAGPLAFKLLAHAIDLRLAAWPRSTGIQDRHLLLIERGDCLLGQPENLPICWHLLRLFARDPSILARESFRRKQFRLLISRTNARDWLILAWTLSLTSLRHCILAALALPIWIVFRLFRLSFQCLATHWLSRRKAEE